MSSAIDVVLENKQAQEFWLRRIIAVIVDYLILWLPIAAISSFAWSIGLLGQVPWVISGLLVMLYSALFEAELGYTIGKRIMGLEVVSLDGRSYDLQRGLVRNVSKIHGILLLIDLLGGLFAENRVNMRYLDIVSNCEVVDQRVAEYRRAQGLAPPAGGAQPAPGVVVQTEGEATEPTMPPEPMPVPAPEPAPVPEPPPAPEPAPTPKAPSIFRPPAPGPRVPEPPEEGDELEELPPVEPKAAGEWEEEPPPDEGE